MFKSMLSRIEAAESASRHLAELVPLENSPVVEEHFMDGEIWQITLSYIPAGLSTNGNVVAKEYKSFAIDARSGEVLSMKIRHLKG